MVNLVLFILLHYFAYKYIFKQMETVTVKEAAEIAGKSVRTIWQWLDKGYITRYKSGTDTVIDKAELLEFLRPKKAD